MKLARAFTMGCLSIVVVLGARDTFGAAGLPYGEDFETAMSITSSTEPWASLDSGIVQRDALAEITGGGTYGLVVSNDTATLDVTNGTFRSYIQIYCKPVRGDTDPEDPAAGTSGAFYVTTGGVVRAWTNAGSWVTAATGLPVADQYLGFTIVADHSNKRWSLYSTSGSYKSAMTLIAEDLYMASGAAASLDSVSIQSGEAAYCDAIAVAKEVTPGGRPPQSGRLDKIQAYEFNNAGTAAYTFNLPVYSGDYTNGTQSGLGPTQFLGRDLGCGLPVGTVLQVLHTNNFNNGYNLYNRIVLASTFWAVNGTTPNANPVDEMLIKSTALLKITPINSARKTWGFWPYQAAQVLVEDGATVNSFTETFSLNAGVGAGQAAGGFTALEWHGDTAIGAFPLNVANGGLAAGDLMFRELPSAPNTYQTLLFNGTTWIDTAPPAGVSIPAGSGLWLYKKGSDGPVDATLNH